MKQRFSQKPKRRNGHTLRYKGVDMKYQSRYRSKYDKNSSNTGCYIVIAVLTVALVVSLVMLGIKHASEPAPSSPPYMEAHYVR